MVLTIIFLIGIIALLYFLQSKPNMVLLTWGILYSISLHSSYLGFNFGVTLGAIQLYVNDLFAFGIIFYLVFNWRRSVLLFENFQLVKLFFFVFSLNIFVLLFEAFFGDIPIPSLYNKSRYFFEIPFLFLYFLSFRYNDKSFEGIMQAFKYISIVILVAFAILTVFMFIGVLRFFNDGRPMHPYEVFFIIIYTIYLLIKLLEGKTETKDNILLFIMLLGIVLMRQRTMWLAFIGGLGIVLINYKNQISSLISRVLIFVFAILLFLVFFPETTDVLFKSISKSTEVFLDKESFQNSTGAYRMARWKSRIESNFDWRVLFFGQGHGYKRTSTFVFYGRKDINSTSFHNHFLEQAFRIGLISVIVLIFSTIALARLNKVSLPRNQWVFFNACYVATYVGGIGYNFNLVFYILVGINLSILYDVYNKKHLVNFKSRSLWN